MKGRVFIIAGSDSGGGAGIQADIKTVTTLGGYAATAITALTAQNTQGVFGILPIPPDFIAEQIKRVLTDIGADCIKIGMLHSKEIIEAVAVTLKSFALDIPIVLDPVMIAKDGTALLDPESIDSLKHYLFPLATLITPNIPEAQALTGLAIKDLQAMDAATYQLQNLGIPWILMKGGHLLSDRLCDILISKNSKKIFETQRINTLHTHGTGCTLASAIATGIAQGQSIENSCAYAHRYVQKAIQTAVGYGKGKGPLNHSHTVTSPFLKEIIHN
ncbi:bifunctional hydroxymethylpyrimidine kinase/phosphomethylpyrimidine kinase [Candidatus Nitrosacidococcus sp. I8]|uniref:bifunctional hydroxymethylpyrimidine kinase/phosphomethylpyrimidine kinase n=1 Tax=Candidatus Nitrosacidococcus sp. I8 TaxID=2942908 RepID=UPI002225F176|nr:bifunctional hydroxymethylpyrimidine kinase/phosphomethylpyrimidine kinase [Candidatus Nitrosacidococcus sp. I8]CAH9018540.1 Hydroxymethylpyrimidine/phosphomethylpyrimidine kinase [Candidatus Nitrosacidococcus sp. I8]